MSLSDDTGPGEGLPHGGDSASQATAVPLRPEDLLEFRLGRLLILLEVTPAVPSPKILHLERIGYYDFFADNPFLIFGEGTEQRRRLILAGFSARTLSYHSAAQRFANRRARLQHDLALLVSRGLLGVATEGRHVAFALNQAGADAAGSLRTFYSSAYRASADLVVRELNRLSDKRLGERAREWLAGDEFLVDLYDAGDLA